MAVPSPAQFARGLYTDEGVRIEDSAQLRRFLANNSTTAPDGSPRLKLIVTPGDPAESAARAGCEQYVNSLADAEPDLAKRLGTVGLLQLLFACTAETLGKAPEGFTQRVLNQLVQLKRVRWWQRPALWLGLGGGAAAAWFWVNRTEPA